MIPQLDDVEAELTYLALREHRPDAVMELGTFQGWSTTWILRALAELCVEKGLFTPEEMRKKRG